MITNANLVKFSEYKQMVDKYKQKRCCCMCGMPAFQRRTCIQSARVSSTRRSKVKRYTDKVAKCERMATLHQLIPRQLFVREDAYQRELEKVSQWSGISYQEIADIYRRKLSDASANSRFKHHGASTRDPYAGFREIPDFTKVNGKSVFGSDSSNNVLRNLDMMRRISSSRSS
jgi:hypothetical protein